jgi:hypothetical protein
MRWAASAQIPVKDDAERNAAALARVTADRPWPPRRPIFGLIRYMSSESALRKVRPKKYLAKYGAGAGALPFAG